MRFLLGLALLLAASATPVLADILQVDFTISYSPPANLSGTFLSGKATFSQDTVGGDGTNAKPITDLDIGAIEANGAFSTTFFPPDPCFGNGTCQLDFSFAGMAGAFQAFAFPKGVIPATPPTQDPSGTGGCTGGTCPVPFDLAGQVVAYDSPVVVGTWQITGTPVAMAEPSEFPSLALTVMGIFLVAWRRRWAVRN